MVYSHRFRLCLSGAPLYDPTTVFTWSLVIWLQADESRNWRFRRILAGQLAQLPPLYHPDDVDAFMSQQALTLAQDPIAYVCQPAYVAVR
jgi:hypothetical protein